MAVFVIDCYIGLFGTGLCRFCIWVELPVQRRLCPIFVRNVGSPDIHNCFRGLTGSQRTPGIWGVTYTIVLHIVFDIYGKESKANVYGNDMFIQLFYTLYLNRKENNAK